MARVRLCAQLAQINAETARMPMGYESLVGDMARPEYREGSERCSICARITRIVVAHRRDIICAAGRVVSLQGGVAQDITAHQNQGKTDACINDG